MKVILKLIHLLTAPLTLLASIWLKLIRRAGDDKITDRIFMSVGVFPVIDHYYQPLINPKKYLKKNLSSDRVLSGIDFNVMEQLSLLASFNYNEELVKFPMKKGAELEYFYENGSYGPGDAEFFYNMIRFFKPKRLIEIGSGNSTRLARNAISANMNEDPEYACEHICIEPYEQPWLEKLGVKVIRERVEELDVSFFNQLDKNDVLFIDSSHMIRPQGDVLFEYLELLPSLNSGVLIHVHDIFSPRDYPENWVIEKHRFWNEQYLLEAFLTNNAEFKIIGALNYLSHHHHAAFASKAPVYASQVGREPGAFWMRKG